MAQMYLIRSLYPLLDIRPMTTQQEMFVHYFLSTKSLPTAARMVGVPRQMAQQWVQEDESVIACLEYLVDLEEAEFNVTRGMLNDMLMQAWTNCADAQEQTGVIREMGKLNGLYPDSKGNMVGITINPESKNGVMTGAGVQLTTIKEVQQLPREELIKLAGNRFAAKLLGDAKKGTKAEDMVYNKDLDIHEPIDRVGELYEHDDKK